MSTKKFVIFGALHSSVLELLVGYRNINTHTQSIFNICTIKNLKMKKINMRHIYEDSIKEI